MAVSSRIPRNMSIGVAQVLLGRREAHATGFKKEAEGGWGVRNCCVGSGCRQDVLHGGLNIHPPVIQRREATAPNCHELLKINKLLWLVLTSHS